MLENDVESKPQKFEETLIFPFCPSHQGQFLL